MVLRESVKQRTPEYDISKHQTSASAPDCQGYLKCALALAGAPIVVLDLRGNPGGLIQEAIHTVDVFLDSGRIVSYSGAHTSAR